MCLTSLVRVVAQAVGSGMIRSLTSARGSTPLRDLDVSYCGLPYSVCLAFVDAVKHGKGAAKALRSLDMRGNVVGAPDGSGHVLGAADGGGSETDQVLRALLRRGHGVVGQCRVLLSNGC